MALVATSDVRSGVPRELDRDGSVGKGREYKMDSLQLSFERGAEAEAEPRAGERPQAETVYGGCDRAHAGPSPQVVDRV